MRLRTTGIALLLCAAVVLAVGMRAPAPIVYATSGLRAWEVGSGATPVVLLHGYGSAPQEWLSFVGELEPGSGRRLVFPEGPDVGPNGLGRGWWRLDLSSHRDASGLPDLSRTRPQGLAVASSRVQILLREVAQRAGSAPQRVVLGGFSQGGMVSAEIAFRSETPLAALVLLSPTIVDEASWQTGIRQRRGLRVFIAHGRQDAVLPFAASARLADTLRGAGLLVTWVPFDGGHDMPALVVDRLNEFLAGVAR